MYITAVPNRHSPPAILLRESFRDGDKVRTRTLANLTSWAPERIEALRRAPCPQGGVRWLHRSTATRLWPYLRCAVCAQAACRACRAAPGAWLRALGQTHPVSRFGARRRPGVSPLCGPLGHPARRRRDAGVKAL